MINRAADVEFRSLYLPHWIDTRPWIDSIFAMGVFNPVSILPNSWLMFYDGQELMYLRDRRIVRLHRTFQLNTSDIDGNISLENQSLHPHAWIIATIRVNIHV